MSVDALSSTAKVPVVSGTGWALSSSGGVRLGKKERGSVAVSLLC